MKRSGGISRRTPLSRARLRAKPRDPVAEREYADVRALVFARSGGHCEVCGDWITLASMHAHHRRRRSAERRTDSGPANLLALCLRSHDEIHAQPARSLASGWLISRHDQRAPSEIPVSLRVPDAYFDPFRWFLLGQDGNAVPLPEGHPLP